MRINRIYVPSPFAAGDHIALTAEGANHVARVLRLRAGDDISIFDGQGVEHRAAIASVKGNAVTVTVGEIHTSAPDSPLKITLVQGVSRGERMDWVIQKATELGVASIIPVLTARSVVKLDREQAKKRHEHWMSIAIGACEQCGRSRLPSIAMPSTLDECLNSDNGSPLRVVLDPSASQPLATLQMETTAEVLIGPEGGLDDHELAAARRAGFVSVTLGPRILRTETAAVVALAVMQGMWGDLK